MSNKRWTENNGAYELIFNRFYEDEVVATLYPDSYGNWICNSDILNWNEEYVGNNIYGYDELSYARKEIEECIYFYYLDEAKYYTELARQFEEE